VPTKNEIKGMKEVMPRIKREWYDQLIVVDANSTDGTLDFAKKMGYTVVVQKRAGLRGAYLDALRYVNGDMIVTFSPDGNSIPELLPALLDEMRKGYDMVIVSRYAQGARSYDDNLFTRIANKTFNLLINTFFRARYTDAMVIYRAYKKRLIHDLDLDKDFSYLPERIFKKPMSWEMLMSIRCAKRRMKVAEIPGDEPPRIGGEKRVHYRWGFAYLLQLFLELFMWR